MSEERDYQYENDLEFLKIELQERVSPGAIIRRMTMPFRHENDHVYAIHVNRSASEERDFFFRDKVECATLFASGHRFCFKNIRDIRDFLAFFDERLEAEHKRIDGFCDVAYPIDQQEKLKEALAAVMDPLEEGRVEVCDLMDREVTSLSRLDNFRDKE